MERPASGEQHQITAGEQAATVVEVGGGLRSYRVGAFEVLDGYQPEEMCAAGRGQVLIPWPNRLRDGRYRFDGQDLQLPITETAQGHAIHGLVRWASWTLVERDQARVTLAHRLHPQPGYPFSLDLTLAYQLRVDGLVVTLHAVNAGRRRLPFGAGFHPYIRAAGGRLDTCLLQLPARKWLESDERQIPTGRVLDAGGHEIDFREPRALGSTALDTAFTDLERDSQGRALVALRAPDGSRTVTVWMDERFRHLMIFTGDTLNEPEKRRGLAVEPMTCPPNAFEGGEDLAVLEPGEEFEAAWGITVSSPL